MKTVIVYTIRPLKHNEIYTKQEMRIDRFGEEQDIRILKKYSDIGYPAINLKRPALNELIKFLTNTEEKIDSVIFFAMEHFAKDVKRLNYVLPVIRGHVKEILFLEDYPIMIKDEQKGAGRKKNESTRKTS